MQLPFCEDAKEHTCSRSVSFFTRNHTVLCIFGEAHATGAAHSSLGHNVVVAAVVVALDCGSRRRVVAPGDHRLPSFRVVAAGRDDACSLAGATRSVPEPV